MDIPLHAQVECTDGVCGTSTYVLINPVVEEATHLVVKATSKPNTEFIVPLDLVTKTEDGMIHLSCNKFDLEHLDPFIHTRFVKERVPDSAGYAGYGVGTYLYWPYVKPNNVTIYAKIEDQQIPEGEMAVQRGSRVDATDGHVGKVDEFVVNPDNGKITHLVMREGHLWGKKDVMIPLSAMGTSSGDTITLNIDKHAVEALPTFPVHRHWD